MEPRLHVSRDRAALSMAVLEQLTTAAIAFLIAYGIFSRDAWRPEEIFKALPRLSFSLSSSIVSFLTSCFRVRVANGFRISRTLFVDSST